MSEEKTTTTQQEQEAPSLPIKLDVTARLVEPKGNLVGFASVCINDAFVVNDFKILQSDKGLFVGMPSKPDKTSKTGYRDTARPITGDFRTQLTESVVTAYYAEVEKLQARVAGIAPPTKPQSIPQQIAEGQKQANKANAARESKGQKPPEHTAPGGDR